MVDHGSEIKFHRWKQFNQLPSTLINLISLIQVMSQSIIPFLGIPLKLRKLFKLLEIKSSSVLDIPHTVLKWRQFQVLPNWKRNVFVECHSWYYTNIEVYLESVLTIKSVWKMSVKFKGPTVGVGPSITSGCGHVLFSISFPGRIFANMAIFIQFAADFSVKKKNQFFIQRPLLQSLEEAARLIEDDRNQLPTTKFTLSWITVLVLLIHPVLVLR